jgi:hypothetical protein
MADIVFTYAPADTSRAHAIAEALKTYGIDAAWDRTLLPGERYDTVVTRRLAEAKAVVVLWSANSISNNLIMDEAGIARDQGKLIPVRIDAVESPMGFRQLQTGDLSGFPSPQSQAAMKNLAEALAMMSNQTVKQPAASPAWRAAGAPQANSETQAAAAPAASQRLFTQSYWGWTAMLGLFSGMLYFTSPEGKAAMTGDSAYNIGLLIGNTLMALIIFAAARFQLYWSRRWVGKPGGIYFTIEVWILLGVSVLVALINAFTPEQQAMAGSGLVGLTHQLNFALIGIFLLVPPMILVVRGVIRLIRGKPAA